MAEFKVGDLVRNAERISFGQTEIFASGTLCVVESVFPEVAGAYLWILAGRGRHWQTMSWEILKPAGSLTDEEQALVMKHNLKGDE